MTCGNLFEAVQRRRLLASQAVRVLDPAVLIRSAGVRCREAIALQSTPFAVSFAHRGSHAVVSEEDGHVTFLASESRLAEGKESSELPSQRVHVHDNAVFDAEFGVDDAQLFTASGDRTAKVFDVSSLNSAGCPEPLVTLSGHTASVRCARPHRLQPCIVATAGRDGAVMIWDTRAGAGLGPGVGVLPMHRLCDTHVQRTFDQRGAKRRKKGCEDGRQHSVTSVQWCGEDLLSVGASDGCLKRWDLRKLHAKGRKSKVPQPVDDVNVVAAWRGQEAGASRARGLSHVEVSPSLEYALTSCLDGSIYVHRLADLAERPRRLVGHRGDSFYVRAAFSRDGRYVASGSTDFRVYVWSLQGSSERELQPTAALSGHRAEVSVVRWGRSFGELLSVGDDRAVRRWCPGGAPAGDQKL